MSFKLVSFARLDYIAYRQLIAVGRQRKFVCAIIDRSGCAIGRWLRKRAIVQQRNTTPSTDTENRSIAYAIAMDTDSNLVRKQLTLRRPLLPYGYCYKAACAKPS